MPGPGSGPGSIDAPERARTGISSYAYRYGIGFAGFRCAQPMNAIGFLREARRLQLWHVQLCENLDVAGCGAGDLDRIRETASALGLSLEVGMKSLTGANLERHLDIAAALGSRFLRIVVGDGSELPEADPRRLVDRCVEALRSARSRIGDLGVVVGIENHFDLATERLLEIVDCLGPPAGLVFDTTNGLGFLKRPEETLATIGDRLVSVHIKDYSVRKVEAGYLISGEALGEGLLDVDGILGAINACNPRAPVLLEMTIRRSGGQSPEEAAAWERDAIERSAARLHEAMARAAAAQSAQAPGGRP